jgi:hypothetical protein
LTLHLNILLLENNASAVPPRPTHIAPASRHDSPTVHTPLALARTLTVRIGRNIQTMGITSSQTTASGIAKARLVETPTPHHWRIGRMWIYMTIIVIRVIAQCTQGLLRRGAPVVEGLVRAREPVETRWRRLHLYQFLMRRFGRGRGI